MTSLLLLRVVGVVGACSNNGMVSKDMVDPISGVCVVELLLKLESRCPVTTEIPWAGEPRSVFACVSDAFCGDDESDDGVGDDDEAWCWLLFGVVVEDVVGVVLALLLLELLLLEFGEKNSLVLLKIFLIPSLNPCLVPAELGDGGGILGVGLGPWGGVGAGEFCWDRG